MVKKIAIQLVFVIVLIAYMMYHDFELFALNGVIVTVILGLWALTTVMIVTLERAKRG